MQLPPLDGFGEYLNQVVGLLSQVARFLKGTSDLVDFIFCFEHLSDTFLHIMQFNTWIVCPSETYTKCFQIILLFLNKDSLLLYWSCLFLSVKFQDLTEKSCRSRYCYKLVS